MFVSTTNEVVIRRPRSRGLVCCLCIPRSLNQTIAFRARHDAIILGSDRSEQARKVTVRATENWGICRFAPRATDVGRRWVAPACLHSWARRQSSIQALLGCFTDVASAQRPRAATAATLSGSFKCV